MTKSFNLESFKLKDLKKDIARLKTLLCQYEDELDRRRPKMNSRAELTDKEDELDRKKPHANSRAWLTDKIEKLEDSLTGLYLVFDRRFGSGNARMDDKINDLKKIRDEMFAAEMEG